MSIPSLEVIHSHTFLKGMVIPAESNESRERLHMIGEQLNVPVTRAGKEDLSNGTKAWLESIKPDAAFVFTFPYKIPGRLLSIPEHGFYNFHPGLLPAYRGIEPIFWQIRNGEKQGGITVIKMDEGFDTGEVVHTEKLDITPLDTYGMHLSKLAAIGANPLKIMMDRLLTGRLKQTRENQSDAKIYPERKRPVFEDLIIDWENYSADRIDSLVRAANPACNGAVTSLRGVPFSVFEVSVMDSRKPAADIKPGTVMTADNTNGLTVATQDNQLIKINLVNSPDGLFSGERFTLIYGVKPGEVFGSM
jgi:methionyl-tRNA formyltransferase